MSLELIESTSRIPGAPMREYTLEQLQNIAEFNPHPAIRAIAVKMAYTMGQRDQLRAEAGL